METVTDFIFLGSKITADGDCSHEIKRDLLLGRKAMTNLDSVWSYVHFSSVTQSCPTLCNPMKCSMPGLPVHHQLPESTQTHVHRVGDAIQPFHSLSSPSPPAVNVSQHQGFFPVSQLFTSGGQSIGVSASTSVLPMNTQDWSPLGWTGWISLQSKGLSRVFSNSTVERERVGWFGRMTF